MRRRIAERTCRSSTGASRFCSRTTRTSSGSQQLPRRTQELNGNHATINKGDRLGRVSHPWRKIRVVEWIVEGIPNNGEAMVTMMVKDNAAAEVAPVSIRAIRIGIRRV